MQTFLVQAGYLALLLFGFVEACSIPISSEITFGFGGVLAYQGHLNLVLVIVVGTLAEVAGSLTSYAIGRKGGRPAVEKYGRYVLLTQRDVDRAERFFDGRGAWSVAIARAVPLLRAFTGLVAGLIEVPVAPFLVFNLIGTLVWGSALAVGGYAVGSAWGTASRYLSLGGYVLAALLIVPMAALILLRVREFRREKTAGGPAILDAAASAVVPDPATTETDNGELADPAPGGAGALAEAPAPGAPGAGPAADLPAAPPASHQGSAQRG